MIVDRYVYLETIASQQAQALVDKYYPVFQLALQDLSFDQFKVVATSLPAIVMAAMTNGDLRAAAEKDRRQLPDPPIDWAQLESEIATLSPLARIRALDYTIEERLREKERQQRT